MAQRYAKDQPAGFINRIERVAIVGAGGQLGKYFAQALVDTGRHTVTALTRADSKNELPAGVKAVNVDYDDQTTLTNALQGQQYLIITLPVTAARDTQVKLIHAAAAAGVRYIMPSYYGSDLANETLMREDLLSANPRQWCTEIEATGVSSWTAMVCGLWYEYSLVLGPFCLGFDHASKTMTFYDDGTRKINLTTFEQCGRAVAALLSLPELPQDAADEAAGTPTVSRWRNKPLYVASFRVSQREMLDSWKRVTGESDADWTVEHEPGRARFERGMAQSREAANPLAARMGLALAAFVRLFFEDGSGDYESSRGLANEALGLPREDLDERTAVAKKMLDEGYPQWLRARLQGAVDRSQLAESHSKQQGEKGERA